MDTDPDAHQLTAMLPLPATTIQALEMDPRMELADILRLRSAAEQEARLEKGDRFLNVVRRRDHEVVIVDDGSKAAKKKLQERDRAIKSRKSGRQHTSGKVVKKKKTGWFGGLFGKKQVVPAADGDGSDGGDEEGKSDPSTTLSEADRKQLYESLGYDYEHQHLETARAASVVKKPADYHFASVKVTVSEGSVQLFKSPGRRAASVEATAHAGGGAGAGAGAGHAKCKLLVLSAFRGLDLGVQMYEGGPKGGEMKVLFNVDSTYAIDHVTEGAANPYVVCQATYADTAPGARSVAAEKLDRTARAGLLTTPGKLLSVFVHVNPVMSSGGDGTASQADLIVHLNSTPLNIMYTPPLVKELVNFVAPPETANFSALKVGARVIVM